MLFSLQMSRSGLAMVRRGRSGKVRRGPARSGEIEKKSFSETYFLILYHKKIRYSAHSILAETFSIVKLMNSGYLFKGGGAYCQLRGRGSI